MLIAGGIILPLILLSGSILSKSRGSDYCSVCHKGIEQISENHKFNCVDCHGGNSSSKDKKIAHEGMKGGKNPSDMSIVNETCKKCHEYQVRRVSSTIMFTNKGLIEKTKAAIGIKDNDNYSVVAGKYFDKNGEPIILKEVSIDNSFGSELYRKFCSSCHIGDNLNILDNIHRSSGCATCHMGYNSKGTYEGNDSEMKNKKGYSEKHTFEPLPRDEVCISCHHRSGRTALSYYGKFDGNNPYIPSLEKFAGRTLQHTETDIHKELGLECIDCHTSREIMGDGYLYNNLFEQLEITCENCHGSYVKKPESKPVMRENSAPFIEGKNYKKSINNSYRAVLTNKGNYFSNLYEDNESYYLIKKRTGKIYKLKIITNTNAHNISGHNRLECYSCHSRSVPQCYGCHTYYDKRFDGYDFIKKKHTNGVFYEKEGFRIAYPFPLGVNQRGKISPITPGCQTNLYLVDTKGNYLAEKVVPYINGEKKYKFAPIYSHNTGKKAIKCEDCHFDPFFAGFGYNLFSKEKKRITSKIVCDSSITKRLDSLVTVRDGKIERSSLILRNNARPLNKDEILKMFKPNLCIICHRSYDDKIYRKDLNYNINDPIHSSYLTK